MSTKTLLQLRTDLMVRLGYGAQAANPPPGMAALLDSFVIDAQATLYRRYDVLHTESTFRIPLTAGTNAYAVPSDAALRTLDPRKVTWAGVEIDDAWSPLTCGIPPELYSHNPTGRPARYAITDKIEVWPTPSESRGELVFKGRFGLQPFTDPTHTTTIDAEPVFLLALANAKAHYGQPDANNYVAQLETMMQNLVAGSHHTRRYVPGGAQAVSAYVEPRPTVPFV
jgi:hypothetical protein